jgi:hypothetical protein
MNKKQKQIQIAMTNLALFGKRISLILQMIRSIDVDDMKQAFDVSQNPHTIDYLKSILPIDQHELLYNFKEDETKLMMHVLEKFRDIQLLLKLYTDDHEPII